MDADGGVRGLLGGGAKFPRPYFGQTFLVMKRVLGHTKCGVGIGEPYQTGCDSRGYYAMFPRAKKNRPET